MSLMVKLDPNRFDDNTLHVVTSSITSGKTVAFPTETFYALGVSAYHEEAINRVFTIKVRERGKPLPLIIEGETMLHEVTAEIPAVATSLIEVFWPGGLTLILRASNKIPQLLTAHTNTVAVRVSSHPIAQLLVTRAGVPITATSANLSGSTSCSSAAEVATSLGDNIDLIIDGGQTQGKLPSTIVDLTSTPPIIVREGIISAKRLKPLLC